MNRAFLLTLTSFLWVSFQPSAQACATCFGNSDSLLAKGMNWGIMTLLFVVGAVLASIVVFFIHVARRSDITLQEAAAATDFLTLHSTNPASVEASAPTVLSSEK